MKTIINFYNQHIRAEDKIILVSLLVAATIGLIYIITNNFITQYQGNAFVNWHLFIGFPLMAGLFSLAVYSRNLSPRMGLVTWTYTLYFFMLLGLGILVYGVQFTPFHPVDPILVKIDQVLGFKQTALLDWTYAHHKIAVLLNHAYNLIGYELSFIPLILALLLQKKAVRIVFMGIIFSFIIGTSVYYFFPTTAPASMFFDAHFAQQQHDTFIKFFQIHHHLPITATNGGLIALPSFHVIWSVLFVYVCKDKKYLFYPIALINSLIILSTLCLGWHYLTDVIAGIAVAALALWVAETVYKKYVACNKTEKMRDREIHSPSSSSRTTTIPTGLLGAPAVVRVRPTSRS